MTETILVMPGNVTTRTIATVNDDIRAAIADGVSIIVNADAVADVDLSFVQLIEVARREMDGGECGLMLATPANASVTALLQRAGFLTDPAPADIDFWFHGALPQ